MRPRKQLWKMATWRDRPQSMQQSSSSGSSSGSSSIRSAAAAAPRQRRRPQRKRAAATGTAGGTLLVRWRERWRDLSRSYSVYILEMSSAGDSASAPPGPGLGEASGDVAAREAAMVGAGEAREAKAGGGDGTDRMGGGSTRALLGLAGSGTAGILGVL